MGYYSNLSGKVTFSRVLNRAESARVADAQDQDWAYYALVTEIEDRDTDEGTLTITRTTGLEIAGDYTSGVRAYEWENVLRAMIELSSLTDPLATMPAVPLAK